MKLKLAILACFVGLAVSAPTMAETQLEKLQKDVDELNRKAKEWDAYQSVKKKMHKDVTSLNAKAKEWEEWKAPKTLVHMSGFADVGYTSAEGAPGSFKMGTFSPIFHFQFADSFMLESELEFDVDEEGATKASVDYMTIDWFMNDHVALLAGKFLSPLGQFRQNIHPSWINKMASAPPGFGHDQAAPNADVGLMARGGYLMKSNNSLNYSFFITNGPTLEANGGAIEKIESPGLNVDGDGKKVYGGRLGFYMPKAKLDLGVSLASGQVSVRDTAVDPITYDASRSYSVLGTDFTWRHRKLDIRGEYIHQEYGPQSTSTAPAAGKWAAWYVQAAYKFQPSNWEGALRYGQYTTPDATIDVNQINIGVNYLFASNLVAKMNYELNTNPGGATAANRWLVQMAYGF